MKRIAPSAPLSSLEFVIFPDHRIIDGRPNQFPYFAIPQSVAISVANVIPVKLYDYPSVDIAEYNNSTHSRARISSKVFTAIAPSAINPCGRFCVPDALIPVRIFSHTRFLSNSKLGSYQPFRFISFPICLIRDSTCAVDNLVFVSFRIDTGSPAYWI